MVTKVREWEREESSFMEVAEVCLFTYARVSIRSATYTGACGDGGRVERRSIHIESAHACMHGDERHA